ncbi:MAG: anaerobic ribonucleoside-triphosphate reductase activating protein [Lentisphaerae bacterium GWF2_45_14]|nr:MAG: anaerobic ribonucleoside-triphosphate reductase activating protein [Lentisphaerae bacterium GWF2_45_14]
MNIRGFQRFTLVDFPGKMACVVFVGECNFRCGYCHNPCLVFDPESQPLISEDEIVSFLERRKGKLDGVVVSGGEPSLRNGLEEFMAKVKRHGFLVKLDTNGSNPERVIAAHRDGLIDALGIDYKAPSLKYNQIANCCTKDLSSKVRRLIKYAVENDIFIDVRTTVHRTLLSMDDLAEMRTELDSLGLKNWTLQQFNPVEVIDDKLLTSKTYSDTELVEISSSLPNTRVRGLTGVFLDT